MIRRIISFLLLFLAAGNLYAGTSKIVEGVISPMEILYFKVSSMDDIPRGIRPKVNLKYFSLCGYRKIIGDGSDFSSRIKKEIVLYEYLNEQCKKPTSIDLLGEYYFQAEENVDGEWLLIDAALILEERAKKQILLEHENGDLFNNSEFLKVIDYRKCQSAYESWETNCISVQLK